MEVRIETLESKNKEYHSKTVSLQDKCADQTLELSELKNNFRLTESQYDQLKKE